MKVLVIGESWTKHTIHVKGFDSFTTSEYEEGIYWFDKAMREESIDLDYIRAHEIEQKLPTTLDELLEYDVIVISDVGSNSFLLPSQTFNQSKKDVNRLTLIQEYVKQGGGFAMIGGYMSFQGIDGRANYKDTAIEEVLPVTLKERDDRLEVPEGFNIKIENPLHNILEGIPKEWPHFLGCNRIKAKPSATVLGTYKDVDFLVTDIYGKGRTLAFASDFAPHWAPPEFVEWDYYNKLMGNIVRWLSNQEGL